jgi:hypothetical protein
MWHDMDIESGSTTRPGPWKVKTGLHIVINEITSLLSYCIFFYVGLINVEP